MEKGQPNRFYALNKVFFCWPPAFLNTENWAKITHWTKYRWQHLWQKAKQLWCGSCTLNGLHSFYFLKHSLHHTPHFYIWHFYLFQRREKLQNISADAQAWMPSNYISILVFTLHVHILILHAQKVEADKLTWLLWSGFFDLKEGTAADNAKKKDPTKETIPPLKWKADS